VSIGQFAARRGEQRRRIEAPAELTSRVRSYEIRDMLGCGAAACQLGCRSGSELSEAGDVVGADEVVRPRAPRPRRCAVPDNADAASSKVDAERADSGAGALGGAL